MNELPDTECPFLDLLEEHEDTCVYIKDLTLCEDLIICPGNGDARCREIIEIYYDAKRR